MPVKTTDLLDTLRTTWPPATTRRIGSVTIRDGQGGGNRVCAASAPGPVPDTDLRAAEQAMLALDQPLLWQVPAEATALDAQLADAGYALTDTTLFMHMELAPLTARDTARMSSFRAFPPLAIQREIWASCALHAPRLAVMERAPGPKTTLMGRTADQPAGAAFAAIHNRTAMVHALAVQPRFRRRGLARDLMTGAARWARDHQATHIAVAVLDRNAPARALFSGLGFATLPGYHYRLRN